MCTYVSRINKILLIIFDPIFFAKHLYTLTKISFYSLQNKMCNNCTLSIKCKKILTYFFRKIKRNKNFQKYNSENNCDRVEKYEALWHAIHRWGNSANNYPPFIFVCNFLFVLSIASRAQQLIFWYRRRYNTS